ncbi:hypothetical protein Q1695_009559 [Nippostrongylus brasiliensis]|nr:hypothetical protein Q1695_009559 [Nippostrongylus brasiliensis]
MSSLATTPIGKQQLIDMKAGAILRGHARKSERYLGCPVRLLLTFIVLIKSSLLCAWLVREYFYFDFRCSLLSTSSSFGADELLRRRSIDAMRNPFQTSEGSPPVNYFDEQYNHRLKRAMLLQAELNQQLKPSKHKKKTPAVQNFETTMVTLTNTQLLPGEGDPLRMKTIRNRVEPMSDTSEDEEDMLEIDIDSPPLVYITKIQQRGQKDVDVEPPLPVEKPKKRKGKGKGKKKKKKPEESTTPASTTEESTTTKKRKGHRRKQNKERNRTGTEQTKSPRHLVSAPGHQRFTTPRPHQSSFLHGVIDPKDPRFSNKGQIRGYPMHIASRKPTPSTRLSEETRLMWEMDELNYTTHAAAQTTVITQLKTKDEEIQPTAFVHLVLPSAEIPSTTEAPRRSFYETHQLSTWRITKPPPTSTTTTSTTLPPTPRTPWVPIGVQTEEEKRFEEAQAPRGQHREKSTLEQLNNEVPTSTPFPILLDASTRRAVKHGFDRSLDKAIDAGTINYPVQRGPTKHHEIVPSNGNFQLQLSTFSSSATCIARTMFDLWCACQLLTLFPYMIGVCVARRSLFVSHLVLDILLLVIGFVYTITMIVFSVVLYILIGEMPKEVLFEWILFALVLDAILLLYACLVVVSLRCCERIVQSRLSMKLHSTTVATEAANV